MKKPRIVCPAAKEVVHLTTRDEHVVICSVVYEQFEKGQSNYENYTIVPEHCKRYDRCPVWRETKEVDWERKMGKKYSSLTQAETIRL
jgi:hypothetical protein